MGVEWFNRVRTTSSFAFISMWLWVNNGCVIVIAKHEWDRSLSRERQPERSHSFKDADRGRHSPRLVNGRHSSRLTNSRHSPRSANVRHSLRLERSRWSSMPVIDNKPLLVKDKYAVQRVIGLRSVRDWDSGLRSKRPWHCSESDFYLWDGVFVYFQLELKQFNISKKLTRSCL